MGLHDKEEITQKLFEHREFGRDLERVFSEYGKYLDLEEEPREYVFDYIEEGDEPDVWFEWEDYWAYGGRERKEAFMPLRALWDDSLWLDLEEESQRRKIEKDLAEAQREQRQREEELEELKRLKDKYED